MRQQGDILIFDYPGGQITFHKDLKKYYDTRVWMWQERDDEKGLIDKAKPATEIQDKISLCLLDFVQKKIIASLANCGLYDLTTEDFLVENPGYHALVEASQREVLYEQKLIEVLTDTASKNLDQAAAIASQSITGMGFGVLSNDFVAHALYAVQSQSVLNRQAQAAQEQFSSMASSIQSSTREAISKGIAERREKTYAPECQAAVGQIFEYLLSKYCDCLSQAGRFDKTCLNGIDEARSNSVLGNLDVVEDKERVLYSAIQLCPYNLEIYKNVYIQSIHADSMLFSETHRDILDFFGLTSALCDRLIEKFGPKPSDYKRGVIKNYQVFCRLRKTISFLKLSDDSLVAKSIFQSEFTADLAYYSALGNRIKNRQPIHSEFPAYEERGVINFDKYIRRKLAEKHLSEETVNCYNSMGLAVFETLSCSFGQAISPYDEADDIIIKAWNSETDQVYVELKQKDRQAKQREIEAYKKERENLGKVAGQNSPAGGVVVLVMGIGLVALPFILSDYYDIGWFDSLFLGMGNVVVILLGGLFAFIGASVLLEKIVDYNAAEKKIAELNSKIKEAEKRLKEDDNLAHETQFPTANYQELVDYFYGDEDNA